MPANGLGLDSRFNTKITNTALEPDLQRPEIPFPFKPDVVAKVRGMMRLATVPGIVTRPGGEDVWEGADLPEEDATEGGKAPKPEAPKYLGVAPIEMEQKAEDMVPKEPPVENTSVFEDLGDDEPEGSTAPPDRKCAAMPGVFSRPSGEDVWEGTPVKDEGATEGGTPLSPDEPLDHDLQVGLEEKAESLGPTDPPDENTWIDDTGADNEPEGSIAPSLRKRTSVAGAESVPVGAPVVAGPIGGPVLQLGPAGFEPGSAPELPLAQPKVPAPSEGPVPTRFNKFSSLDVRSCRAVDPIIDFVGEGKGHQDGGLVVPGILQALKLVDELLVSYGGLEVPRPQRPKTPPPPKARAVTAF